MANFNPDWAVITSTSEPRQIAPAGPTLCRAIDNGRGHDLAHHEHQYVANIARDLCSTVMHVDELYDVLKGVFIAGRGVKRMQEQHVRRLTMRVKTDGHQVSLFPEENSK